MSYASLDDLIRSFGTGDLIALTDRGDPPAGVIDTAVAAAALDYAQSLIDGYLSRRYVVPLVTAPDVVRRWACDVARHRLYLDRSGPTEAVQRAFDDVLRQLRDAAAGTLTLAVAGVEAPETAGGGVKAVIGRPVFDAALDEFRGGLR